ncbi:CBL-interacting serine/threonine-protein kinase 5 [Apostasia shenzhenica]|uniref:non-specific serine/threonine protein kinase n=1 Tax=Apostasia shenzhenica TaxID=1088818 RepID=A0A2I0BCH3_9ASPA|nr:CBL-interacting serine/threonine-protein kinase 5 [Apostasia shenzhenica]
MGNDRKHQPPAAVGGGGGGGDLRKVVFGKYEMGRLLGQGTFGKVYHGRDLRSGESVAVKVIGKDQIQRDSAAMAGQIQREISVMRLVRHPNVVELREVLATRTRIFFVMEFVRGGELFDLVARGRLPEDLARRYFRQLVSAVDFCHSRGVSHRDLKPENLLLDHRGNLKISDFGLSALPDQLRHDGLLHTQCGTPAYVAPEVLRRRGYDGARADVWSCGVILYVLLAGFLPFQDENLMRMYSKISRADYQIPPWFSPEARSLLSRLLVADPAKRASIAEILRLPWLHRLDSPSPPAAPIPVLATEPCESPRSYNAFEFISAIAEGFDLSPIFEGRGQRRRKGTVFTSRRPAAAVVEALERTGRGLGFGVTKAERGGFKVKLEGKEEGRKGTLAITAEVFEAAAGVAVVEFSKDAGDTIEYVKFCEEDVRPGLKDIVWAWPKDDGDGDRR